MSMLSVNEIFFAYSAYFGTCHQNKLLKVSNKRAGAGARARVSARD